MFFTLESIKSFVVDLDSFSTAPSILTEMLPLLSGYEVVFVSNDSAVNFSHLPIDQSRIFRAETQTESQLFQNVIRKAMSSSDFRRKETVFVTTSYAAPLQAAQELLLGTILYASPAIFNQNKLAIYQNMPDFLVHDLDQFAKSLDGQMGGHFAESHVAEKKLHPYNLKSGYLVFHFEIASGDGTPVHFSGRYFKVEDARHHLHPLSLRIINAKRYPERHAEFFASIFAHLIMWKTNGAFDLVAVVPPKPGQTDRNALYAEELEKRPIFQGAKIGHKIALESIRCIRDYGSLKNSGGANQRANAIKGAFEAGPQVSQKKIVLLDDVYSTGSTMNECINTLLGAGATEVIPVVLAYHPLHCTSLGKLDDSSPACSGCSGRLVPRFNKTSGDVFFGCENFLQPGSHITRTFLDVQRQRLNNAESLIMAIDEEMNAWSVPF